MEEKNLNNSTTSSLHEHFIDAIPAGVNIIDKEFNILSVNRWMEEKFEHKAPLVGQKCFNVTHDCQAPHKNCPSLRALKSGQVISENLKLSPASGLGWVQVTSFPVKNENGEIFGCIEYIIDISEKKRDEQLQNVMLEISNAVHNTVDTSDLIRNIRVILGRVIDTNNFFIALYDKKSDSFQLPFFADEQDEFDTFPAGKSLTGLVVKKGVPLLLDELEMQQLTEQGEIEMLGSPAKVWLGVPLLKQNGAFGAVVVQSYTDKDAFGQQERDVLKFVSDQIAIAIERKQTEEKLQYERTLMQALLDNTNDLIYFKDSDGHFIKTSRSHCRYLGLEDPSDVIGKTDFDFYSHEMAQHYADAEKDIIQHNTSIVDREEKAPLIEGSDEWFSTTKIPLKDENNKVIGLFGITRQITMQKRTEYELRQSEIQYRTTLNAMLDAIHVVDPNFRIILANSALFQLNESFGLDTDVLGKKYSEIYPFLPKNVDDEYRHVFETGEAYTTKDENIINGTPVYSETRKIPIFENNKVVQVLTVIRDTTQQQRREIDLARLAAAVEQAGDSIIIIDKKGTIVYVNPLYERSSGDKKEDVVGKPASILKSGLYTDEFYSTIWQTLASGKRWNGHLVSKHPDGRDIEQDITISPIFNEKGEIENFISVGRDVTNEIKMQKQLAQAQKMEAIGTLAGGIAHDFNNILSSIIGFTQLSQMRVQPGSQIDKNLSNILKTCDRARDLTQQILLYSRGDEEEKHPLQINLVVKEAIKLLQASLPSTISIICQIDDSIGFVLGTSTQIHQILMNLATNAAHAMPDETGEIYVNLNSVTKTSQTNGTEEKFIQLVVKDTGHGIPEEIQGRIFDPFFTTKPTTKGTGLGLSVVHGIVNSMGGEISVFSEPDNGALFEILFPQLDLEDGREATASKTDLPQGSETILFVDDEADIVQIGDDILSNLGYTVVTSTNSSLALEIFQKNPEQFDLIITDQTMPFMTGVTLAKKIRDIKPSIPVILCTGYSETVFETEGAPSSISKVIVKPFYFDELSRLIRELLDLTH